MAAEYTCPFCRAGIPLEDVNVSTDVALCRACGQTCSFAQVSGASEIDLREPPQPPRWTKISSDFYGGTRIVYRRPSPLLFFLVPFTALWSGGSIWGLYVEQFRKGEFSWEQTLFGLPFLLGTIVLLSVIIFLLVGKWVVALDNGDGRVFVGVGPIGRTRRFRYDRATRVYLKMTNYSVNEVRQKGIAIKNNDEEMVFGATLKEDVKLYIAGAIQRAALAQR